MKKISGKWIFLGAVFVVYAMVARYNFGLVKESIRVFESLLLEIVPALAMTILLMFVSNLFLDTKKLSKLMGGERGVRGWVVAVMGGIFSTGPAYVWYPLLKDLKEKKMSNSFIATFLYNGAVKIPLLPVMVYYFGMMFTLVLTFYMVIFSIINGVIIGRITR